MNDKLNQTQRILRSPKVKTDDRGRTVWVDPIETASLELVSTQMLKQLIEAGDNDTNNRLRQASESGDGLLARDMDNGRFEVISDEELQRILDGTDAEFEGAGRFIEEPLVEAVAEEEELELVSTQMLRIVLGTDGEKEVTKKESDGGGFNPYDHS